MRLLLIEDEKKVADFVARGLRAERFAVDLAGDGPDGDGYDRGSIRCAQSGGVYILDQPKRMVLLVLRPCAFGGGPRLEPIKSKDTSPLFTMMF